MLWKLFHLVDVVVVGGNCVRLSHWIHQCHHMVSLLLKVLQMAAMDSHLPTATACCPGCELQKDLQLFSFLVHNRTFLSGYLSLNVPQFV